MNSHVKRLAVALLSITAMLGVTACTNEAAQSGAQPSAVDQPSVPEVDRSGQGNFPDVTGDPGAEPTIAAGKGDAPKGKVFVKTLNEGSGDEITSTDTVLAHYKGVLWDGTGFDSSYERGEAAVFSLSRVVPGWTYGLEHQHVGDRVEIVIPPEWGYGSQEAGQIPANSTLVFVVEILDRFDVNDTSALQGATATDATLPNGIQVSGDPGAKPTLAFSDTTAPTEDSVTVIAEGTGAEITEKDYVFYQAVSAPFGDASQQQSTWDGIGAQQAPPGTPELVGKKVGSRVLLVFKPTADASQSGVDPSQTTGTVLVVDIVGTMSPSGAAASK